MHKDDLPCSFPADHCRHVIEGTSGEVLGQTSSQGHATNCVWMLQAPVGKKIFIEVLSNIF